MWQVIKPEPLSHEIYNIIRLTHKKQPTSLELSIDTRQQRMQRTKQNAPWGPCAPLISHMGISHPPEASRGTRIPALPASFSAPSLPAPAPSHLWDGVPIFSGVFFMGAKGPALLTTTLGGRPGADSAGGAKEGRVRGRASLADPNMRKVLPAAAAGEAVMADAPPNMPGRPLLVLGRANALAVVVIVVVVVAAAGVEH